MTRRQPATNVPAFPEIEAAIGENPARWLIKTRREDDALGDSLGPLLDGMDSLERLDAWIVVERQLGPATKLLERLATRRREVLETLGEAPAPKPTGTTDAEPKADAPTDDGAGIGAREPDTATSIPGEFWGTRAEADAIAAALDGDRARELLARERREGGREVVVAALEARCGELGVETDTTQTETEPSEVTARAV